MTTAIPYLLVQQANRTLYLTSMKARSLCAISYVSLRKPDNTEEGAVQRPLNKARIASLKRFAQSVGDYPACVVLNWVGPLTKQNGKLEYTEMADLAQLIDGQHRIAGLKEAIVDTPTIGELDIPVAIYENLDTNDCAKIFLAINTEQKPAPPSLVYDLFGIVKGYDVDPSSLRATDIAKALNADDDSPYRDRIRMPGVTRSSVGIGLSSAVNAIKPLVEPTGALSIAGAHAYERQLGIVKNLLTLLRDWYDKKWSDKDNVFQSSAGFTGAVDFLASAMVTHCRQAKSFKLEAMKKAMNLHEDGLIWRSELKNMQGRAGARSVTDRLKALMVINPDDDIEY